MSKYCQVYFAAPLPREDVTEWANQEAQWTKGLHNPVEQPSWKHGYVIYLKIFYKIRSKWEQATDPKNCSSCMEIEQVCVVFLMSVFALNYLKVFDNSVVFLLVCLLSLTRRMMLFLLLVNIPAVKERCQNQE